MWDFIVRVVCERECEDLGQLKTKEVFMGSSHVTFRKVNHVLSTWLECEES